jgi:RNA polymerase sigma factor (sigma-70 family)
MTEADQGGWNPPLTPEEVAVAFDALSPKERELFCLVQADGLSHEQAAARCGISVERFQRRLARALGHLRRKVERGRKRRQ